MGLHLDNCTEERNDSRKASCERSNVASEGLRERSGGGHTKRVTNNWSQDRATKKSSYKERRVDAKAPYAEEGRGQLRKATGNRKQVLIRGYPNGETRRGQHPVTVN